MAQTKQALEAQKRSVFGRKVKTLRREGILPANIYGKKVKSLAVQVPTQDFEKAYKVSGETNLIQLKVGAQDNPRSVLATNIQRDPISDAVLHVDFHQVDLKEKVEVAVPIEITGEAPAVKEKGAVLIRLMDEVEVEALPQDLPDQILIDISGLKEFDDSILIKELKVGGKVKLLAEEDEAVIMVQEPKEEEVEPPPAEAAPEAEEEKAGEEEAKEGGEESKEGEQKTEEDEEGKKAKETS